MKPPRSKQFLLDGTVGAIRCCLCKTFKTPDQFYESMLVQRTYRCCSCLRKYDKVRKRLSPFKKVLHRVKKKHPDLEIEELDIDDIMEHGSVVSGTWANMKDLTVVLFNPQKPGYSVNVQKKSH